MQNLCESKEHIWVRASNEIRATIFGFVTGFRPAVVDPSTNLQPIFTKHFMLQLLHHAQPIVQLVGFSAATGRA